MTKRIALALLTMTLFGTVSTACQKEKGPFEKAGEEIDEEVNDAKRKIEDVTD